MSPLLHSARRAWVTAKRGRACALKNDSLHASTYAPVHFFAAETRSRSSRVWLAEPSVLPASCGQTQTLFQIREKEQADMEVGPRTTSGFTAATVFNLRVRSWDI